MKILPPPKKKDTYAPMKLPRPGFNYKINLVDKYLIFISIFGTTILSILLFIQCKYFEGKCLFESTCQ